MTPGMTRVYPCDYRDPDDEEEDGGDEQTGNDDQNAGG